MAGGVPNLGLDDLIVDLNGAGGELDADGGFGLLAELILGETGEEVGFSDAGVADQHHLEKIIVILVRSVRAHLEFLARWIGRSTTTITWFLFLSSPTN